MTDKSGKLIKKQRLKNGIELFMYDQSRLMAGDRWQVELKCEAHIPIEKSFWDIVEHEDSQLASEISKILGDRMVFVTTRQRNFVDVKEQEPVFQEMMQQVFNAILKYLEKPHFPQELFKKQYSDAHKKVLIRKAMENSG